MSRPTLETTHTQNERKNNVRPTSASPPTSFDINSRLLAGDRSRDVARFLGLGGLLNLQFFAGANLAEKKVSEKKNLPAAEISFETNLAKSIGPSPKGLVGFLSFEGGAIFLLWGGGLEPPSPSPCLATSLDRSMAHAWAKEHVQS